ncbi:lysylphosphatidylglycerol synthase domain-containing protein [Nocardioides sp. URHA0020]|uniref:lysylphosphatidylglycerol synthase domain-containing protein n=1 Tax=Nocardioides sp. URHA0020 TaxID=1380392 RepID=UPI0018CC718A|nr:lysylphosphatidylglycerol synthase domain-containing protein [Nocardioides sp. URHA0020]
MRRTGRWLLGVCLAVALLTLVLPMASGVSWASTWAVVAAVPVLELVGLVGLWALGLLSHTITLTAALPRLTHRRALTLSLTGSAVANVLPLGGAAGIALNGRMARTWGYGADQFVAFTVITNVWDVLAKLALPLTVVPAVACATGVSIGPALGPALIASLGLALGCAAIVAALSRASVAARVGGGLDRVAHRLLRAVRSPRRVRLRSALVELQASCSAIVRARWLRLSLGMVLYTALLLALLWACLAVTGAAIAPAAVLAGFAVERLLTLAGLTPGGAGVVEVGLTGALIGLGGAPASVVAGVLLYRTLTYGLEIPVGGVGLAVWLWLCRGAATRSTGAAA